MPQLRGKPAEKTNQRLKLLLVSAAGVGKTTAILQIPKTYIIDTEKGTTHYDELINKQRSHVWESNSLSEIIKEVRELAKGGHDFTTFALDTFTTAYDAEVDTWELKIGNEWGRHVAAANKVSKRLYNLITLLDMNVIMTTHEKNEYGGEGDNRKVIGQTFDGWKKLDYLFDLVLYLSRNPQNKKQRLATVKKTRLSQFPDGDTFVWSYDNIIARFPKDLFTKQAGKAKLCTEAQIDELKKLIESLTGEEINSLGISKVVKNMDEIQDLSEDRILKGIKLIENYNIVKKGGNVDVIITPAPKADKKEKPKAAKLEVAAKPDKTAAVFLADDMPAPQPEAEPKPKPDEKERTPEQQKAIDQVAKNKKEMAEQSVDEEKEPMLPDLSKPEQTGDYEKVALNSEQDSAKDPLFPDE